MWRPIGIASLFLLILGGSWVARNVGPGGDGVLATVKLADGTECALTQEWNGWGSWAEPYTVSFWVRQRPEDPWGWCYLDHEATRWRDASLRQDGDRSDVLVFRGDELRGALSLERGTFRPVDRPDGEWAPDAGHEPPFPIRVAAR